MSYTTRRSAGAYGQQQQQQQAPQQQNVGNIGQRRPVVTNNFVSGGEAKPGVPAQQNVPQQQPARQGAPQQKASTIQFRNQAQATQQVTQAKQQQQVPAQQQQVAQQQVVVQQAVEQIKQQEFTDDANGTLMETGDLKPKKPFWARGGGKISRKEKVRRRNVRLSKMLQPKNAVMILNELVKNTSYVVEELTVKNDGNQFKASVLYEGIEHTGYGRSKIHAKNVAAEAALKHYIKTNKLELKKDEDGNEKMDVSEDETNQAPLPWQHVASFALYKLFCSWGEDPNIVKSVTSFIAGGDKQNENKPAKKMPDNAELINPLMLINQMLPQAQFEEIGKTGSPPNVIFSFRCNVNDQSFVGTGPNKKAAKKMAAFGACNKVLGVNYPPEVYVPSY